MARHKKRTEPASPGLKAFVGILGILVAAMAAVGVAASVKDADRPAPISDVQVEKTRTSAPQPVRATPAPAPTPKPTQPSKYPLYQDCQEAKEADALPLTRGEPGYLPQFDQDQDGTACEGVR